MIFFYKIGIDMMPDMILGYYYSGTDEYDINWTVPQCVLVLRLIGMYVCFW